MINIFLGVALVAAPFFIKASPRTSPQLSQEFFFALATMLVLAIFGIKEFHRNTRIMAVSLVLVAFISVNPFGLFQYFQLALCFIGVIFIMVIYSERRNIRADIIGKILALVCILESAWLLLQWKGIDIFAIWLRLTSGHEQLNSVTPTSGSLGNVNHSGALIACTMPFLPYYLWPIPFAAIVFLGSTMPVICAVIGITAYLSYKSKNYILVISGFLSLFWAAIALIAGLIPTESYFSDSGRLTAWKELLSDLGLQPFGKGLGYIPEIFSQKVILGARFYHAHNEWIELYAIGGIIGVMVGAYLIVPIFVNKGRPAINACLIALAVNSLGNFTFHIAPLFMVFGVCYALQLSEE